MAIIIKKKPAKTAQNGAFDESDADDDHMIRKIKPSTKKQLFLPKKTGLNESKTSHEDMDTTISDSNQDLIEIDDDDYMSMVITDDSTTAPQNLWKGKKKKPSQGIPKYDELQRDAMTNAMTKSLFGELNPMVEYVKKPFESDMGLPIGGKKSVGLSIMEKMGFKVGQSLGKEGDTGKGIVEPIIALPKTNAKGGIGFVSRKKEVSEEDKSNYRKQRNLKQEESIRIRTLQKMQRLCFQLNGDGEGDYLKKNPLDFNVLWRGYLISLGDGSSNKEIEHNSKTIDRSKIDALIRSFGEKNITTEDKEKDTAPLTQNIAKETDPSTPYNIKDDVELNIFNQLPMEDRLNRVHSHLRSEFNYCFYCGAKYKDQEDLLENCPGAEKEDHM